MVLSLVFNIQIMGKSNGAKNFQRHADFLSKIIYFSVRVWISGAITMPYSCSIDIGFSDMVTNLFHLDISIENLFSCFQGIQRNIYQNSCRHTGM